MPYIQNASALFKNHTQTKRNGMIRLSNGHELEFVTASGATGWNGKYWPWERLFVSMGLINPRLFTHISKTVTMQPTKGNLSWYCPWTCIRPISNGTVNAVGLTNPGFTKWEESYAPMLCRERVPLIISITTFDKDAIELEYMARVLNLYNVQGIEYNPSCPNRKTAAGSDPDTVVRHCEAIKEKAPTLPLLLKLSVVSPATEILSRVNGIVDALDINSVPWNIPFPNKESPLAHLGGGGVSGKAAQKHTWEFARRLEALSDVPVIWPSIWSYRDLATLRNDHGQNRAFSFGSIHIPSLRHPLAPLRATAIVRKAMRNTK